MFVLECTLECDLPVQRNGEMTLVDVIGRMNILWFLCRATLYGIGMKMRKRSPFWKETALRVPSLASNSGLIVPLLWPGTFAKTAHLCLAALFAGVLRLRPGPLSVTRL